MKPNQAVPPATNSAPPTGDKPYTGNTAQSFDHLPVAVYTCDINGYINYYNPAAAAIWGREPLIGSDRWCGAWKLFKINGEPLEQEAHLMINAVKGHTPAHTHEVIAERPDGTRTRIKPYPAPIYDSNGNISGAMCTLINITEIIRDEEKQATLAAIVETSDDTIISKTLKGIITSWNRSAERMFGYTEQEAIGRHISLIIPPERINEEDYIIGQISQGNRVDHFETIRRTKDGRMIPISVTVSPIKDSNGNVIGASKIARDLSDKRAADERQAVLAAIVDTSDDTIISKTLKGIITSWNRSAERLFGYTEDEVLGKHISILIPTERLAEEDYIIGEIAKGNKVDHFETIRQTKSGRLVPLSISVSPLKDSQGNIIGASKIARDITLQKEAQEATRRYAENLEIINYMIKTVSEELELGKIMQKVTDASTELTGAQFGAFLYNMTDVKGDHHTLYAFTGTLQEEFKNLITLNPEAFQQLFFTDGIKHVGNFSNEQLNSDLWTVYGDAKNHLPASYMAMPVHSRSNQVIGGLLLGHPDADWFTREQEDMAAAITSQAAIGLDNAQLYEEIRSLNEKKDEFIGLASHELKTPLTSITGYLQILDKTLTEEKNKRFVGKTIQQVKKLSALVSDLLDVSKIQAGKLQLTKETFDLSRTLHDAIELIQYSNHTHHISLNSTLPAAEILGDAQRIEQVLINLLTNAIKYSPGANEVIVSLNGTGTEIIIGVKDFGMGIPPDHLKHIFSRFYRVDELNPTISGLGIGLYISHEIVERHKGRLWAESEYGKGSTFWLSLPIN